MKLQKKIIFNICRLPEIGDDMPEKNPLLKEETKLPEFNKFTIEKCIAAIGRQAVEMEQGVRNLEEKIEGKFLIA